MESVIKHDIPGRLRIHAVKNRMSLHEADILEYYLRAVTGVKEVKVYDRTCDAVIYYDGDRTAVTGALSRFSFGDEEAIALVPDHTGRSITRHYQDQLVMTVIGRVAGRIILPAPVRLGVAAFISVKYIIEGLQCLAKRK
ncbi:MAG: heavy metal translocating P-type ATPase, partial [Firmicutes bacterium]|nr:heavy metal translocating P-type ATPase [Bacillota bacterium]